ncbi:MAG: hypothetical protein KAT34_02685 [Candidatus Aminicenantes bacterium]|nr:hypothetical protein [Candidatus Aminicenantes bacterium]
MKKRITKKVWINRKRHKILMLILIFSFFQCSQLKKLQLGDPLPYKFKGRGNNTYVLTSPSSASLIYKFKFAGIKYKYGVNEKGIIDYISTVDPDFKTEEGFSISSTFSEITKKVGKKLRKERGWAYFIPLKSGWNAAFACGRHMTDCYPNNNDKVRFFFKRSW